LINSNNLELFANNNQQDFYKMNLKLKEMISQIPIEPVQQYVNEGIQKLINESNRLNSSSPQAAFTASIEKSKDMILYLSNLFIDAFNNVNKNINTINERMDNLCNMYIEMQNNCSDMWNKQEEKIKNDDKTNIINNQKIDECINICSNSKKKLDENDNVMAIKLKNINSKIDKLESNSKELKNSNITQSKKIEEMENNLNILKNSKKIINKDKDLNNNIYETQDRIKKLEDIIQI